MELQNNTKTPANELKIIETVEKYTPLLEEKKPYEFVQKIKLLSHRKQQTKKISEAELLLLLGIEKCLSDKAVDDNDAYDMFEPLLKLYEGHPEIWSVEKSSNYFVKDIYFLLERIYQLLNIRSQNEKKYEIYVRLMKTVKKGIHDEMVMDLCEYYIRRDQFTKAESHIVGMDLQIVREFLTKWMQKVYERQPQEATAIQCRVALLRGIFTANGDHEQLLEGVNKNSGFYRFTDFLLSAVKIKSREAYNCIGSRYEKFLQSDVIFNKIYKAYGTYYFKIDNSSKGSGLMGLFSN